MIERLAVLNDSKQLSKKRRESIYEIIKNETIHSIVCIEVAEIEEINILNASLKAMKLACDEVIEKVGYENLLVLVDGNKLIKDFTAPQEYVVKGDGTSASGKKRI